MAELELSEVRTMLDGGIDEAELQLALQALIFHQCLYEEWPNSSSYRLIAANLRHIRPIIAAFGFRLEFSPLFKMLAVKLEQPGYGVAMNRLRKDETVVLLCLRLLYEEQMKSGSSDDAGRVLTISSEIYDQIMRTTGEAPPQATRLFEILNLFQRRGLVRVGHRDEDQVANVTIYPGITLLVPDLYVSTINNWLEGRDAADKSTMLQQLSGEPNSVTSSAVDEGERDNVSA